MSGYFASKPFIASRYRLPGAPATATLPSFFAAARTVSQSAAAAGAFSGAGLLSAGLAGSAVGAWTGTAVGGLAAAAVVGLGAGAAGAQLSRQSIVRTVIGASRERIRMAFTSGRPGVQVDELPAPRPSQ